MSTDVLIARWTEGGDKIASLADEFPAERYDFSPAPEVRTFAAQLRHVAFWNHHLAATLRGERPDGAADELSAAGFAGKPAIAAAVRESFAAVAAAIAASEAESAAGNVISFIGHNAEHYGQMVISFRLSGLVPPASR